MGDRTVQRKYKDPKFFVSKFSTVPSFCKLVMKKNVKNIINM